MAIRHIVVGVTENETSQHAARTALEHAQAHGAELHFVTVVRHSQISVLEMGGDRWEVSPLDGALGKIESFVRSLSPTVAHSVQAIQGDPADVLLDVARNVGADLIVVGNVRMQGPGRLLGSVGEKVLRHTDCDVLVVKTA